MNAVIVAFDIELLRIHSCRVLHLYAFEHSCWSNREVRQPSWQRYARAIEKRGRTGVISARDTLRSSTCLVRLPSRSRTRIQSDGPMMASRGRVPLASAAGECQLTAILAVTKRTTERSRPRPSPVISRHRKTPVFGIDHPSTARQIPRPQGIAVYVNTTATAEFGNRVTAILPVPGVANGDTE